MERNIYIQVPSSEIDKMELLFDAFSASYEEYILSYEKEEETPLAENQFNSLRKRIMHCVLRKIDTHMRELFEVKTHMEGCTICKWATADLPKMSEEDLKKKREQVEASNIVYGRKDTSN